MYQDKKEQVKKALKSRSKPSSKSSSKSSKTTLLNCGGFFFLNHHSLFISRLIDFGTLYPSETQSLKGRKTLSTFHRFARIPKGTPQNKSAFAT